MIRVIAVFLIWFAGVVSAQTDAAAQARAAAAALDAASEQLEQAASARDRVRALTEAIQAFEAGLAVMRSGLRQVAIQEASMSARLATRELDIATLLAALQRLGARDAPTVFLHPGGALGTARAGMLVAEVTPELSAQAMSLRRDLEEVQILQALQINASERLEIGLKELQSARTELNEAIANRTELPRRFTNDPVRTAILIASSETLDGFASGLSELTLDDVDIPPVPLNDLKGALPLPVQAVVLRGSGEADAAGVTRPGLVLAARPRAIVTSPSAATIRYSGPLLDLGQVLILEPGEGVLFIFAGLDIVYGEAGQVIEEGAPLGLMGANSGANGAELSTDGDATGAGRTETLYIEVRQDDVPQDPKEWFRTDKDG